MKQTVLLLILVVLLSSVGIAQAPPQGFNYSSVIRDENKQAIPNTYVSVRLSVVYDNPNGSMIYQEIHKGNTNKFGVLNLTIGGGIPTSGIFEDIDWSTGHHYLQTELDDKGGENFELMGMSQFLSVPYALYSGVSNTTLDKQVLSFSNDTIYLSNGGYVKLPLDNDTSSTNELQVLSISNDTIFLSDGGFVKLPPAFSGVNTDNQTLSYNNDTLSISNGNSIALPNMNSGGILDKKIAYENVATGSIPNGWRPVPYLTSTDTLQLTINVTGPHETFIVHAGYSLTNLGPTSAGSKSAVWVYSSYGNKVRDQIIAVQHLSNGQMIASCAGSILLTDLQAGQYTVRVMHNLNSASSPGNLYYEGPRHLLVRKL